MGNFESDELPQQSNLQSFSSPYSPQFFINKTDFKGKSIKQIMKDNTMHYDFSNKYYWIIIYVQ